jgi:hypothetical protein
VPPDFHREDGSHHSDARARRCNLKRASRTRAHVEQYRAVSDLDPTRDLTILYDAEVGIPRGDDHVARGESMRGSTWMPSQEEEERERSSEGSGTAHRRDPLALPSALPRAVEDHRSCDQLRVVFRRGVRDAKREELGEPGAHRTSRSAA